MRQVILGLGTGRCGTASLTALLDFQDESRVTHEGCPVPWDVNEKKAVMHLVRMLAHDEKYIGDVGYYWLNYVPFIIPFIDVRFICMYRPIAEVVGSYMKEYAHTRNLMVKESSEHYFPGDPDDFPAYMPRFDLPMKEAIEAYCDGYYDLSKQWEQMYPTNFRIFDIDNLNTMAGVQSILRFAGFENIIPKVGIRLHGKEKN